MNDAIQDSPQAGETCRESAFAPQVVPPQSPPLSIDEVLSRFRREATRGTCDTRRYRCPYFTWGEGPPLLFVPGMANDALSFAPVMARLATQFRCIGYDYPAGQADGASLAHYSHADLAADALALLDHLHERQSYLLGFSFGSTVALAALRMQPERWPRAILLGGFARRRLAPAEVLLARLFCHWRAPMQRLPWLEKLLHFSHHGPMATRPPDVWRFFIERCSSPAIAAVARRALLLHRLDLTANLADIRQPTLLITGDQDPLVKSDCTEQLRRTLPSVAHIELDGCGHYPMFSHPDALADVIRQFLVPACSPAACPKN
ncbi:MAG: alpha/beta hydrolase [Gemmataceae bacterium]|nr:alpha/beta hydrolase [Gemmataceae bacterium]